MATMGNIIFWSMIVLIIAFTTLIILILALSLSNDSSSTSSVVSRDRFPLANLGQGVLLSCHLTVAAAVQVTDAVAVTWTKANLNGEVYKYQDSAPQLEDQNPQFDGRTQVFPDAVARGNGSLLIMAVTSRDDGVYTCSISSSNLDGSVHIHLRTAAYSKPTFSVKDGTLTAMGSRWQPEPEVTWLDSKGTVLQGITLFTENATGMYSFVSSLKQVNVPTTYTFKVQNLLVTATSSTNVTGSGVTEKTTFSFSGSTVPVLSPSRFLLPLSGLLMYAVGCT
ncbi:unnamed protein product [Arctogadus glacialis]